MLSNLTPAQEPVAWYAALGVLINAALVLLFVFSPREGLTFSGEEQAALSGAANGAYFFFGALLTRKAVIPTALPPEPPAPPAP